VAVLIRAVKPGRLFADAFVQLSEQPFVVVTGEARCGFDDTSLVAADWVIRIRA
jgi:hypothetical protein